MFDISQLVIERNVPIPGINANQASELRRFLEALDVGDSVVIPLARKRLPSTIYRLGDKRYRSRTVTEETCRVWRIA